MKTLITLVVAFLALFPLLTSCTTLRLGTPVKASYDAWLEEAEKGTDELDAEGGWAARYVPGWKTVSNLLPPPTQARKDWDKWLSPSSRQHSSGLP